MVATGQEYTQQQNMFDLHLLSTYGWSRQQVDSVKKLDGISDAEGSLYLDAYVDTGSGKDRVFRLLSIPESINRVYLLSGEMPSGPDECLADGAMYDDSIIGQEITVTAGNEQDTLDTLTHHTYTVVGVVSSPLYMDMTRGSTTLGSGTITGYFYMPPSAFDMDYYTGIYATRDGDWTVYSREYNEMLDQMAEILEPSVDLLGQIRFMDLVADAERQYADGLREYKDGLQEYEKGRAEALQALADALVELEKAQAEIDEGWVRINDGQIQLEDGQKQLDEGRAELDAGMLELEKGKAEAYSQIAEAYQQLADNEKLVKDSLVQVTDGLKQIDDGLAQIDNGISQIDTNLPLLELMISMQKTQVEYTQRSLDAAKRLGNQSLIDSLEATLAEQTAALEEYQGQYDEAVETRAQLEITRAELEVQRTDLIATEKTLRDSLTAIEDGRSQLQTQKAVLDNQFAAAAAKINAGYLELEAGQRELDARKAEWLSGKQELLDGQAELDAARLEYEQGKADAEAELADAKAKLDDAAAQLADARKTIDEMESPSVYVLTRNTNAGYLALDSNSDIVDGIAEVLPVFFLLIASLVCITTLTRMVEEERTQIGTLKALGHSGRAIMGKYLWYSVSAAVLGCSLGILAGCTFYPNLLWNAYGIIFNIRPDVALTVDWSLCLGITAAYILCSTLVTWYCCFRTLQEVPAELIRPKAPESGRKSLLEKLTKMKSAFLLNYQEHAQTLCITY
jgi:putative ABC transport system permease protein